MSDFNGFSSDGKDTSRNLAESIQFDYTNQAWVVNGRYERCGHQTCKIDTGPIFMSNEEKSRYCYGTQHVGERPLPGVSID